VGTRTGRLMVLYTGGTPQIINDVIGKHIADATSY
jgi:hypothetical protein